MYLLHKFVKEGMSDNAAWEKACAFWHYTGPKPVDKTRGYKTVMRLAAEQGQTDGRPNPSTDCATSCSLYPFCLSQWFAPRPWYRLLQLPAGSPPAHSSSDSIAASVKAKRLAKQEAIGGVSLDHQYFTSSCLGFLPPPSSEAVVKTTDDKPAARPQAPTESFASVGRSHLRSPLLPLLRRICTFLLPWTIYM